MKLYTVLTAVAVSALISTAAFAGGKTTSFGIGGAVYVGGNTGNWSSAGSAASGQADVTGGSTTNNFSSGNAQTAASAPTGIYTPHPATVGAASHADATNYISTNGTGQVDSSTSVSVASGTGTGIGGGLIVGGGANSLQH